MSEADLLQEFRDKYHVERLTVAKNASWTWSVRTVQATLGSGMLSPHRPAPSMGEVTRDEMADLASILHVVEHTVHAAFQNDKINYIALMMVDPLAHVHFFPRYQNTRDFAGHEWQDSTWPNLPGLGTNRDSSTLDVLDAIATELRRHLPSREEIHAQR
jgi:diadenosine tetraphosphate (Ap4A) HIT family hydrolase